MGLQAVTEKLKTLRGGRVRTVSFEVYGSRDRRGIVSAVVKRVCHAPETSPGTLNPKL